MKSILIIIFFVPITLFAQNSNDDLYKGMKGVEFSKGNPISDFSIDLSPTLLLPSYYMRDVYKNGFGGVFTLNKSVSSRAVVFLESGLVNFKGIPMRISSKIIITAPAYTLIPINLGFRYNLEKIFIGLGAGVGLTKLKNSNYGATGKFMINPMIGYDLGRFKISANYAIIDTELDENKFLGLRVSMRLVKLNNSVVK